ncbi:MAG: S8 family serine peptidase, partial [Desulfobacteraceae bacterium]|nr:S8 family serine peptidase [Desulfobacteraceae bacterium]
MSKAIAALLVTVGIVLFATSLTLAQPPEYRSGELLVRFKPNRSNAALARSASTLGIRPLRSLDQGRVQQLLLPDEMSVEEALTVFQNDPDVEFAEPNYLLYTQSQPDAPDDPYFTQQWGLQNSGQAVSGYVGTAGADIDAVSAWELMISDSATVVAVVDTGCNMSHPDLAANVWTNPNEVANNGSDDDGNGYVDDIHGWDFADGDNAPQDASGHGTHVAGIIAASHDNGIGISGTARHVRIMPLRFMNAFDTGTVADAIRAIEYAINNGARIINCSWGSSGFSSSLYGIMATSDALFVCAAGNNGTDNDQSGFYPASYNLDNVISVAAGDQMDDLTWFSNYGKQKVHVAAPGVRIYSLGLDRRALWSEDFSLDGLTGWTLGGAPATWSAGTTPYSSDSVALRLTPNDTYADNADTWAMAPRLDLSNASGCKLSFQLIGSTEANRDYLYVELSTDGASWSNRPVKVAGSVATNGISGVYPYWTTASLDLGPFDGVPQLFIRWRFKSNDQVNAAGFFIDGITDR